MEAKEIEENDRLIAEFDGWQSNKYLNLPNKVHRMEEGSEVGVYLRHLPYHSDWSLLMPVAEKIATINDGKFSVEISSVGMWACFIKRDDVFDNEIADFGGFEPVILNVWKAVVKFIKWHNAQSKN